MFLESYGLIEQPFGVTPDPRFLYLGSKHREALASLLYGTEANRGFLALIAKPGMGKTSLLFQYLELLRNKVRTAYVFQTDCDARELLRQILKDLGVGAEEKNLRDALNQILTHEMGAGRRLVLVIDEAQGLNAEVLESVRLLSNFETQTMKLMQIVIAGQPQLAEQLARPSMIQFRQRISSVIRLEPFTPEEINAYIRHRLEVAGYKGPPLFTLGARELIAKHSGGIPRNINNLCFNAMSLAYAMDKKQIDSKIVGEVISDLAIESLVPEAGKVDEWTAAFPDGATGGVAPKPDDEESPEEIVSKIMEQALTEKRHSPAMASPSGKPGEGGNAAGATLLLAPPDTTVQVAVSEPHTAEPPEACTSDAAPATAASAEESVDLLNAYKAPTTEPHESESTEEADLFMPPGFTPTTVMTGDLWSASGPMASEIWDVGCTATLNLPALNAVDTTPSSAGSLAPERLNGAAANFECELPRAPVRKWPAPSLPARPAPTEQNQDSSPVNSSPERLVPLTQHIYAQRSQFLRGSAIGILCLVMALSAFKFWTARQGTPPEDTQKAVAVSSSIASGYSIPEPAYPPSSRQESRGSGPSKKGQNEISSRKPPVGGADLATPVQPSRTSGIASGDGAAPRSAQDSSEAPTNAIPRPNSFTYRNPPAGSGNQLLFGLSQGGNSARSTGDAESGNGQAKVAVDLRSTPWSFHPKNIHLTLPVGGEVRPAELISSVAPHYPEAAKALQISGDVVIDAIIDAGGNIRKPQVVSGPTLLRSAAVNAVLGWKYKPTLLDGKPTEARETIIVKFLR